MWKYWVPSLELQGLWRITVGSQHHPLVQPQIRNANKGLDREVSRLALLDAGNLGLIPASFVVLSSLQGQP